MYSGRWLKYDAGGAQTFHGGNAARSHTPKTESANNCDVSLMCGQVLLRHAPVGRQHSFSDCEERRDLVDVCRVLEVGAEVASHAADIRWALESAGTPIGLHDVLIAATAKRHQHTLATHNTREFSRVPDLHRDDWY